MGHCLFSLLKSSAILIGNSGMIPSVVTHAARIIEFGMKHLRVSIPTDVDVPVTFGSNIIGGMVALNRLLQPFPQLIRRLQPRMPGNLPRCADARHQHAAAVLEVEKVQDELVLAEDGLEQGGQGRSAHQEQG